jgi:hypothetical protein
MDTAKKKKLERVVDYLKALRLSWTTVVMLAVVLAFADGFVLLAFQGAVGAVERQSQPFHRWIGASLLLVPFFAAAVVVAMILTRRWAGKLSRRWVKGGVAALLIVATSAVLGASVEAVSGAYDYSLQTRHIDLMVATHSLHNTGKSLFTQATTTLTTPKCDAACQQKHNTIVVHIRSVFMAAKYMLIINLVLTAWMIALRGGRLWAAPKRKRQPVVAAVRGSEGSAQPALV